MSWSWSAATTTARTSVGCGATSASSDPVLVGVDAGADALLEAGHRPDVVVVGETGLVPSRGDPGTAASPTRPFGVRKEVVLHSDRAGRAVGSDRLDRIGVRTQNFSASGSSEDVALLLADLAGASLIVSVGTHATLDGVPGPAPLRARKHVPDPAPGRPQARRRQGRTAALRRQAAPLAPLGRARSPAWSPSSSPSPAPRSGRTGGTRCRPWLPDATDWLQGLLS